MAVVSVSDEIYNHLSQRILDKEWLVGAKLPSESKLCAEFGVSRISVRSAIQRLQAQDLVSTRPGKGSYVIANELVSTEIDPSAIQLRFSKGDYQHFVEFRRGIDFYCAELMCTYATEEDYARLAHALDLMRQFPVDSVEFTDSDLMFHTAIIQGSHNPIFISIMQVCEMEYKKYMCETNLKTTIPHAQIIHNHEQVYQALRARDAKSVRKQLDGTAEFNLNLYFQSRES